VTAEQLAQLAQSLKDNEAFQAALMARRAEALEQLVTVKRDDADRFQAAQAMVRVVDDIRGDLDAFVRAGTPAPKPGIA